MDALVALVALVAAGMSLAVMVAVGEVAAMVVVAAVTTDPSRVAFTGIDNGDEVHAVRWVPLSGLVRHAASSSL